MYTTAFGFARVPFTKTIPSEKLFREPQLDELHSRLTYLVENRAIGLITGEPGSGKSTALRRLRDDLHPDQVRLLYLHDTAVSPRDFCHQIAFELGIPAHFSRAHTRIATRLRASTAKCRLPGRATSYDLPWSTAGLIA